MTNYSWKITNSISQNINLVAIDVYTDQVLPSAFLYEQTLELLTGGDPAYIKPGTHQTFSVPDVHKDKDGNALPYTFIIAVAETLAPVAFKTFKSDLSNLKDVEITDEVVKNINNVYDFVKNIAAFPTSDLAIDFANVMKDGVESKIEQFFKDSIDYQNVKIDDVHLVQSYYKALPYGWAAGKNSKFYLYATDYKNNTDSDEPIGEINIKNDWSLPAPLTPNPESFKVELTTYDDRKTTQLQFKDGVFWDSITTDTPKTALAGSFIMPSELTMDNSRNSIEVVLLGRLNNYRAFALNEMAPHDQDGEGGFLDVFQVHNFKEGLDLALYFIGIGTAVAFLIGCYYGAKYVKNKFKSDDTLEMEKNIRETQELIRQTSETLNAKIDNRIPAVQPEAVGEDQLAARQQLLQVKTRLARVNIQNLVDSQSASIETMANVRNNQALRNVVDNLAQIENTLNEGPEAVRALIEEGVLERLQGYNEIIAQVRMAGVRQMNQDQQEAYADAQQTYNDVREVELANEREIRELREGLNEQQLENHEPARDVVQGRD